MLPAGEDRTVRVEPIGVTFSLVQDESLIQAAWREGYHWPTVCGGRAECTVCHVHVEAGEQNTVAPDEYEKTMMQPLIERTQPAVPVRMACRLRVTGPVTVYKRAVRKKLT